MFGFSAFIGKSDNPFFDLKNKIRKFLYLDGIVCENNMISKFEKDKLFYKNQDFVVILDGVVLNKKQLMKNSHCDSWSETILIRYLEDESFFSVFRGSFSGLIYDRKKNKTIIFTDQIGSKFLFYKQIDSCLFVTSMMPEMFKFLKTNSHTLELDEEAAYMLLSYGYMLDAKTLLKNVFKLNAGCYIVFEDGKIREKRYCLLDNTPDYSLNEKTAIELIDNEFRRATKLEFDKDNEYNYKHIASLSAGLDSRMTSWVAHELGYKNQVNLTFSQSDYLDESVPQKIASDLKHEWIFKSLDDGAWLTDAEEITNITGGNALYYGLAHSNSIMRYLNFSSLGMLHTGQLGDVVIGTFYESNKDQTQYSLGDGAYSKKLISKICHFENYSNQEIAKFYHRGFNGANAGQQSIYQYTETCSPFMDWDFMNNVLKIPISLRYRHNIYKKWVLKCYPDAANYIWEKIGCRINRRIGIISYKGHSVRIEDLPKKVLYKICPQLKNNNPFGMNPLGYYLHTNEQIQNYIDNAFQKIPNLIESKELISDLNQIRINGTPVEIIEAVSLLKAIELMKS